MRTNLFAAADWLKVENNQGFGLLPIPRPRDGEIEALLCSWMALDAQARQASAQGILEEQRFTLLGYSERMASLAVRKRDQRLVVLGLVALGVDGWRLGDWRDNALLISLHYDAAQRIAADAGALFENAASLLPPKPASALRSFLRRPAVDKTIEAMGYVVETNADGFRYRRTW
jgi:hypothetical protein